MNTSNNVHTFRLVRVHYKQCDSTQTRMQELLSKTSPKQGLVITSDYQSAGRGQLDSNWQSLPNLNIAFSILFRPHSLPIDKQFYFNIWSALATIELLKHITGKTNIKVKWPNDIMIDDLKLGGILIQSSLRSNQLAQLILGVGLNVNESMKNYSFPATSLRDVCQKYFHVKELQEQLITAIYNRCSTGLKSSQYKESWMEFERRLWKLNETVEIREEGIKKKCKILGVQPSGELNVEIEGEIRNIRHKEIEFIIK